MRATSRVTAALVAVTCFVPAVARPAVALQGDDPPLLQLEVRDRSGLPLPNAKLELFAYAEGGLFREWVPVVPGMLGPGVHLLRFSHSGFEPVVFSVPVRRQTPVSLRVELDAEAPRPRGGDAVAVPVNAIGLALDRRAGTDILGSRRVLDRHAYERTNARGVAEVLRVPSVRRSIGASEAGVADGVLLRNPRTGEGCAPAIMLNGDVTLALSFARYQELYRLSEPEVVEFVLDGKAVPYTFKRGENLDCPVMMIWLRGR